MAKKGAAPSKTGKLSFKARPKKKLAEPIPAPAARLKAHYDANVKDVLKEAYGHKSDLAVGRITKVVVNMGIGDANDQPKKLEALMDDLEAITGQRPTVTRSRVSVANFNLREGMAVGCRVTLRRTNMWEFLDRLITVVIPRMRDFRGLSPKSFDGRGNYAMGLSDQIVFPEINADRVTYTHGMNIVVCTTARTDEEARELLRLLGFPFRNLSVVVVASQAAGEDK